MFILIFAYKLGLDVIPFYTGIKKLSHLESRRAEESNHTKIELEPQLIVIVILWI